MVVEDALITQSIPHLRGELFIAAYVAQENLHIYRATCVCHYSGGEGMGEFCNSLPLGPPNGSLPCPLWPWDGKYFDYY